MRWWAVAVLVAVLGVGAMLRLGWLGTTVRADGTVVGRVMHGDEAVQAFKFQGLWERGEYKYDPDEYHGPTLPYVTYLLALATGEREYAGMTEGTLRVVPALAGIGVIGLMWLLRDGLGRRGALAAAGLAAVSPAMVFFSRYFIHEMLLVFFTAGALATGWQWWQTTAARGGQRLRRLAWAGACGASVAGMLATKETAVFTYVAAAAGLAGAWVWGWLSEGRDQRKVDWVGVGVEAGIAGLVMVTTVVLLFSSFGTYWPGVKGIVETYWHWGTRAAGPNNHLHPWYYYLRVVGWYHEEGGPRWSEWGILALAAAGAAATVAGRVGEGRKELARFVLVTTVALTGIYALVPYKTPWCALSFLFGMIVLAGIGVEAVMAAMPTGRWAWVRVAVGVVIVGLAGQLGWQAWRACFVYQNDARNPWVYAHPVADVVKMVGEIDEIAAMSTEGTRLNMAVVGLDDDYWPLPWYLRRYPNVGFFRQMSVEQFAQVIAGKPGMVVMSEQLWGQLGGVMQGYHAEIWNQRVGVQMVLCVRDDLWGAWELRREKGFRG